MDAIQVLKEPKYVISIILIIATLWYMLRKKYRNPLPPGPTPLPIIGNLLYMKRQNLPLYRIAMNLREQYGNIVKLQIGPSKMFLIMGRDAIHKAAVTMNDQFKFRPTNFFVVNHIFGDKGILFTNGETNSALRKYTLGAMREFGVGKRSLEERILEEADMVCEVIEKKKGKPFCYTGYFKMVASNIIAGIVYGNRFEFDDPVFHRLLSNIETLFKELSFFLPENFLPILRFLPGSKLTNVKKRFQELQNFAEQQIKEHRSTFDPENVRDFVDMFLQKEGSGDPAMTEENLFRLLVELFNAGTDTTAVSLTWGIIHMIRCPEIQAKCRAEIMKVVGVDRHIGLEDKKNMPYLQAFIDEVQRYSAVAPQTAPHTVLEDIEFEGYTIPKNSVVTFVLFSLLNSKEAWGDSDNFRPGRFLDENGERKSLNEDYLTPFGLGGRSCIGKHLAKMELFLYFGTLIQRFEFKAPEGAPLPSIERIQTGVTCQPQNYDVCAIPYGQ